MELTRRNLLVYGVLAAIWALVVVWQVEEHMRVREAARNDLSARSRDIANTVSACLRGMRFRGTVWQQRLEPLLNELVNGRTNELVKSSELLSLVLVNTSGEPIASAGHPIDLSQQDLVQKGERWGARTVTFVNPVDLGAALISEGSTNPVLVLPAWRGTNVSREGPRPPPGPPHEEPRDAAHDPPPPPPGGAPPDEAGLMNLAGGPGPTNPPPREPRMRGEDFRSRRPPWMRGMSDEEYQSFVAHRSLHGLVLAMSTDSFQAIVHRDLLLRGFICLLASVSVLGSGLAWRNLVKSSDLQIRLVRASELNTHLRELSLAAAGLAHETRNPLNLIRGRAQIISKQGETPAETKQTALQIVAEADKVAAQLNEFINYSRPREVRPTVLSLSAIIHEVVRALSYDLEEKRVEIQTDGESLHIEADEQLLRQALFNLLLNAIQAVATGGKIQVSARRAGATQALLEVRDNGPGVPPERRTEVFKPYFTTQKQGTGLGLAVVQQIILAHGWEIQCLANEPRGALFQITHIRIAPGRGN